MVRSLSSPTNLISGHPQIHELCRSLGVRELHLFGSALTERFDPESSDLDFLVDFFDAEAPGISDRYLQLAEGLEKILHRPVDLVTVRSVQNPVFREAVFSSRRLLYAA